MFYNEYESDTESSYSTYEDVIDYDVGRVKCTLCNVFIPDNENCIENHIDGRNHTFYYNRRLSIRNSIHYYDEYCNLCDENFEYLLNHIETPAHKSEMDAVESLISGEFIDLPDKLNDDLQAQCTICNCIVGFTYHNLEVHINGRTHRGKRAMALKPLNGIFNVEKDNEQLWCKICDLYIDNTQQAIFDHVDDDADHYEKLNEIENLIEDEDIDIENYLTDVSESKAQCNKCKVPVPCCENNIREHIDGYQHSN